MSNIPCRRAQITIPGLPLETFITLVSIPPKIQDGVIHNMRLIESIDDHSDVIHMSLNPIFLFPTWSAPRDFVLMRYWRYDEDGSYIICFDSVTHRQCQPIPGMVRGELHAVYTICPKKQQRNHHMNASSMMMNNNNNNDGSSGGFHNNNYNPYNIEDERHTQECLLTYILQIDPKGWLWNNFNYRERFVNEVLLQILDVRDCMEVERFMHVNIDTSDGQGKGDELGASETRSTLVASPSFLLPDMWAEPEATPFVVRGPNYVNDRVKVPSEQSIFQLMAVDIYSTDEKLEHIASHPNSRIQKALKTGDAPPFTFIVNLIIPTEKHLSVVFYWSPEDMSCFNDGSPFSKIAQQFFFGEDDTFRDKRFKLIPKILEGNFLVKKAAGSTPVILGTKLKQYYYRNERYLELDVDIGSSSTAAGVCKLAYTYAKTLIVDLAMVLQGETLEELPEQAIGCVRLKNIDMTLAGDISMQL